MIASSKIAPQSGKIKLLDSTNKKVATNTHCKHGTTYCASIALVTADIAYLEGTIMILPYVALQAPLSIFDPYFERLIALKRRFVVS